MADLIELILGGMLVSGFGILMVLLAATTACEIRDLIRRRRDRAATRRRTIVVTDENGGRRYA
jgi:hypothetical protein